MDKLAQIISKAFRGAFPNSVPRCVAGIGFFDGVHLGHQALAKCVVQLAKEKQAIPVILTFDPQPRTVIHPDIRHFALCTLEQKQQLLADLGIKKMIIIPFSLELAERRPEEFLYLLLDSTIDFCGICVGENWRFGKNASGSLKDLQELGAELHIPVFGLPILYFENERISSTRVRQAILQGDLLLAEKLLGRPYAVSGEIIHGRGIGGKMLDCPTANIVDSSLILPPSGSYISRARIKDEDLGWINGITYMGNCPTFGKNGHLEKALELHLFDLSQDLYGRFVEIELLQFIRPEMRFDSVEDLKKQVNQDLLFTQKYFADCNKIRH